MISRVTPQARKHLTSRALPKLSAPQTLTPPFPLQTTMPFQARAYSTPAGQKPPEIKNIKLLEKSPRSKTTLGLSIPFYQSMRPPVRQYFKDLHQKRDERLGKILGFTGAGIGLYLLTKKDREVLAEEALSLAQLKELHGIDYEEFYDLQEQMYVIVLKKGDQWVGEIEFYPKRSTGKPYCYIGRLLITKDFRNRRIGSTLLNRAIQTLETHEKCKKIRLTASPLDPPAGQSYDEALARLKKYYERSGFKAKSSNFMIRVGDNPKVHTFHKES
jgi:predicted GNAT family N-acyltransferase